MYDLKELGILANALTIREIPFALTKCNDGWSIVGKEWDVAINIMTIGSADGFLELYVWGEQYDPETSGIYGGLLGADVIAKLQKKGLIPKD